MKCTRELVDRLRRMRVYPHIYFFGNPFKYHEFRTLMRGVRTCASDVALDIGCGTGLQTQLFGRQCGRVIGIDPDETAIRTARADYARVAGRIDCAFEVATIETAGFADASFDKVFSLCVLEHIADDRGVLQEVFRVLRPGGGLHMSVDSLGTITNEQARERHARKYEAHRYYEPDPLRRMLTEIGFVDISIRPALCSAYARDLFTDWVLHDTPYGYGQCIWLYQRLRLAERLCRHDTGIFLIVHARKPGE